MSKTNLFDPLRSIKLISHEAYLDELINLFEKNSFPNALMLSGKKGIGKYTLLNHFLNYIFSKNTKTPYDLKNKIINTNSMFYNSILNNTSQNVIFLNAEDNKKIKIDDIRNLRILLSKTTLNSESRFIIIDEVDLLSASSANALLKILEEPSKNNFFILINNNQSKVMETISSRCIKNNIFLSPNSRKEITRYLIDNNDINPIINFETANLTPGLYLEFNNILLQNNILLDSIIFKTISSLLQLYKKSKNTTIINLCGFLVEQHFYNLIVFNKNRINILIYLKNNIIKILKDLVDYNLNVNSVINSIETKMNHV